MKKKIRDISKSSTVGDLDDLAAQIVTAIGKTLESYPTKEDLKPLATKEDLKPLEKKVDTIDYNVSDIRRRVIDLETIDPPTRAEFNELKAKVAPSA